MTAAPESREPIPALYLVTRFRTFSRSLLERIAHLYRLYSYGDHGLTLLVRAEIERAALALTAVFLFDFAAWTLIWNAVFHRGEFIVDRMSVLAASFGLLFAIIVVSFEQGVMTTDWTEPGLRPALKRWGTLVLRLFVIGASAYATSQSIEVMVFSHDIADRVHQERVWEEVVSRALQFQKMEESLQGRGDAAIFSTRINEAQQSLESAVQNASEIGQQLASAQFSLKSRQQALPELRKAQTEAQKQLRLAKFALDEAAQRNNAHTPQQQRETPQMVPVYQDWATKQGQAEAARLNVVGTEKHIKDLEVQIAQLAAKQAGMQPLINLRKEEHTNQEEQWKEFRSATSQRRDALQHWITLVANSSPDQKKFSEGDYSYEERPYSFAEQLRVLNDLQQARAPQRHNVLSIRQDILQTMLGLEDPSRQDQAEADNRRARSVVVRRLYLGLFVLAIFVPSMGILFKLTMHPQLTAYYSAANQARNGNLEAMQYASAAKITLHEPPRRIGQTWQAAE